MKLFKVVLIGFNNFSSGEVNQTSYVVADDPTAAYNKVLKVLNDKDYGFSKDREMDYVELMAEATPYSKIGFRLFM